MERIEDINKRLLDTHGRGVAEQANYRVVFANSQTEIITTWWEKHTSAGIYLGKEFATREVKKYPMYEGYWILEFIQPNLHNKELNAKYSYEPIWVFRGRNDIVLPPDWEAIEKIIYFHINRQAPPTARDLENRENSKKEQESVEFLDYLKHDGTLPSRMYDTPMVTVPSTYKGNEDV